MLVKSLGGMVAHAVVAILLLVASPASAAPAWLPPVDLSPPGSEASQPQVAVDPAGNAVAIWQRSGGPSGAIVESASRPVGGSWSQPTKLSAPEADPFGPQLAVDPQGNAVAIWFDFNGLLIESAYRPAGGDWSPPTKLSAPGANIGARVAVDRTGNAMAIWQRFNGTDSIVESASRPLGGSWLGPVEVSAAPGLRFAERPQIALDPSGNAIAIWDRRDGSPGSRLIESAYRPAGGGWSEPSKLSAAGAEAFSPQIAFDSAGNAVAVWDRGNGPNGRDVESAARPIGGDWSGPTLLSVGGINSQPQLAVDPAGNATAIWHRSNGTESIIESASRSVGGGWSGPTPLSAVALPGLGIVASRPQLAVDPGGNAVAVWDRISGPDSSLIESAVRPAGGSWSGPIELTAPSGFAFDPQIDLDPSGNAVAIWAHGGTNSIIRAAALDGGAPKLQGLAFPAAGRTRSRLHFAVSALDSWSPLGPVSWSFGDRKGASGLSATHVYTKPGRYQLTLQVADVLGNATSTAATIPIAPNVKVARLAKARKGKARLSMRCPKPAKLPCRGFAQLSLKRGKTKKLKLGQRSFTIPGAKHRTLAIKLSPKARRLLAAAGPKGLAVSLSGDGLRRQTLRLRRAPTG
jgi:PKD domain